MNRRGFRRYELVVFPPGVTTVERRLLRLWRALPTWVAVLWLISVICLSQAHPLWVALGISTALYVAVGAVTLQRLGALRTRVHTLSVALLSGGADPTAIATYAELKTLAAVLCTADALLGQGRISVIEHEAIWWQAYDRVGRAQSC